MGGDKGDDRLGKGAVYTFCHPNFMVNRYGPWMDTNTVFPTGHRSCTVMFDWYVDSEELGLKGAELDKYIEDSLIDSDKVQQEDDHLCRVVQEGLESGSYKAGRYAPTLEMGMHKFHQDLHADLSTLIKDPVSKGE